MPSEEDIEQDDLERFKNNVKYSLKQEYYIEERTNSYVKENIETIDVGNSDLKYNIYGPNLNDSLELS